MCLTFSSYLQEFKSQIYIKVNPYHWCETTVNLRFVPPVSGGLAVEIVDDYKLQHEVAIFSDLPSSDLKWFIQHVGSVPVFFWRKNMPKQRVMWKSVYF